jgi:hypothetical protein
MQLKENVHKYHFKKLYIYNLKISKNRPPPPQNKIIQNNLWWPTNCDFTHEQQKKSNVMPFNSFLKNQY